MSPFLCRRIQLTAVPSILCTISLIHIAASAYESRQNLSCFAVQQTKQKIAAVASGPQFYIQLDFEPKKYTLQPKWMGFFFTFMMIIFLVQTVQSTETPTLIFFCP